MTRARLSAVALLAALAGCEAAPAPDAGALDPTHRLGLNDVTWLFPLERLDAGTPFPPAAQLLSSVSVERLTTALPMARTEVSRLRVVGLRFDRCDRSEPGVPCPATSDGLFRVVLQPVLAGSAATEDLALHAFYPVPVGDVPAVVTELRELASLQGRPRESRLQVSEAWTGDPRYRAKLGALLSRYATSTRLKRLTLFGRLSDRGTVEWVFRGEQLAGTTLAPIVISGVDAGAQEVLLTGADSYRVTPVVDAPAGFASTLERTTFDTADGGTQRAGLESLVTVDDPRAHTADTVQCVSCHVATTLLAARAGTLGVDPATLPGHFPAPAFDLTALGEPAIRARTLRALGYLGDQPLVSQRVVNETANVVLELDP
ncbi:MAG: hypothetical protein ACOZQL_34570 [Myxococcota bacterium]